MALLANINGYSLASHISEYPANSVMDFSDESYEWAATWGMCRTFPNEKFHWIKNNCLFGHKCSEAMLASVNGTIYKISFRHHAQHGKDCMAFREAAYALLWSAMGPENDRQTTDKARLVVWDSSEGNVILEATALDTQIILTSSVVRSFVRTGLFAGIVKTLRMVLDGFLSLWGQRAGGGPNTDDGNSSDIGDRTFDGGQQNAKPVSGESRSAHPR